jgi:hypothetical protein
MQRAMCIWLGLSRIRMLISIGSYDGYVAKFNPVSNQFVWAQRAGGMGSDFVNAMAVSSASVYVVGAFGNP